MQNHQDCTRTQLFHEVQDALKKWLLLLHCWVRQYPAKDASEEAMMDNSTVCDVYR